MAPNVTPNVTPNVAPNVAPGESNATSGQPNTASGESNAVSGESNVASGETNVASGETASMPGGSASTHQHPDDEGSNDEEDDYSSTSILQHATTMVRDRSGFDNESMSNAGYGFDDRVRVPLVYYRTLHLTIPI